MSAQRSGGAAAPTRVGIVSDTHGYLDPFLLEAFAGCAHIVHAGDVGDPAVLDALATVAPVTAVRGNIDGGDLRFLPLEASVEIDGRRIGARHIAGSPVRPKKAAAAQITREGLDVFVCGHSHVWAVQRVHGALWLNPGAAGKQGFHKERTAMRLVLAGGEIELERVNLPPRWP